MRVAVAVAILALLTTPAFAGRRGSHLVGGSGSSHKGGHYVGGSSSYSSPGYSSHSSTRRYSSHGYSSYGSTHHRSASARRDFEHSHPCPSTGRTSGACPGYVVDHVNPLACGGADDPSNMQWQTTAEGKAKDKWERAGCSR